jgi:hypothetical protein
MKTKYILVGGYPNKGENNGKNFYLELINGKTEPVKVLICLFARPKDDRDKVFLQDKLYFDKNFPHFKKEIKIASENNFLEELKWCDTVYFRGGDIYLENILTKYKNWIELLDVKTVAGSSMGAYMLSKYYYDISTNEIKNGLGLTDTKVIVHWQSDQYNVKWNESLEELRKYKIEEDLEVFALAEGEFVII